MSDTLAVRIGQKHRRGVPGERTVRATGFKNIDVTSASKNLIGPSKHAAKSLSPMALGPIVDKQNNEAKLFENYWQSSKMWPTAGHCLPGSGACEPSPAWYRFRARGFALDKGKRRPLPKKQYGFAQYARYNDEPMGYVESRKRIYVPLYYFLIKDLPVIGALRESLSRGEKIMIVDNDGPSRAQYPEGMPMTVENWRKMIDDPSLPFGHGYVVAGILAGLPEDVMLDVSVADVEWARNAVGSKSSARVSNVNKKRQLSSMSSGPMEGFFRDSGQSLSQIAEPQSKKARVVRKQQKQTAEEGNVSDPLVPTICYVRKSLLKDSASLDV